MIFYALICRIDGTILVEATSAGMEGNFPQIAQLLVEFLKEKPLALTENVITNESSISEFTMRSELFDGARRTFVHSDEDNDFLCGGLSNVLNCAFGSIPDEEDLENTTDNYYFHTGREENLFFLCLADDVARERHQVNFAFLEEIHALFLSKFSQSKIERSISYGMEKQFSHHLRNIIHKYNTDPTAGKSYSVAALNAQIDHLKSVMGQNISIMLRRGNNIESLLSKAERLEIEANVFTKRSANMKKKENKRSFKYQISTVIFILLILYIIAASFCGLSFEYCVAND